MIASHRSSLLVVSLALLSLAALPAAAQTKLLRFPDLHGERVVFCYGGDLWYAPTAGGTATRLTAHAGQELFPKFSPDGKWIAFTGQYDGDEQVYVIPSDGGVPTQLTWYPARGPLPPRWGYDNQVYGWSADGAAVLFRSLRDGWGLTDSRLYTVPAAGGLPVALPMPVSGAGAYSPDMKRVVYSPLVRDFRTWKRYQGGWAQDLWIFDLAAGDALQITDHPRADRDPMWLASGIYFTSDRSGTNNVYRYDPAGRATTPITNSTTWDVRWPSDDGQGRIVHELDGELVVLEVPGGRSTKLAIRVPHDGLSMRPSRVSAAGNVEDFDLAPKGERALFAARGDVFTAPIEHGATRNLTRSPGAHDRSPAWSPDGKWIAFVSDRGGEDDYYLVAQDGSAAAEKLTELGAGYRSAPAWSPDSERFAFHDQRGKLFVLELEGRGVREIADDPLPFGLDYTWSPDSQWLAFSLGDANDFRSLYLWQVGEAAPTRVSDEMWNEYDPAWDTQGKYLYFLSDRDFAPQLDSIDWNFVVNRETGVFALALKKDAKHPLPPRTDEVKLNEEKEEEPRPEGAAAEKEPEGDEKEENGKEKAKDEKPAPPPAVEIDLDGLWKRVARLPIPADNLGGLTAVKGHLLYLSSDADYYGRDGARETALEIFSFDDRKETVLMEKVDGYALSPDGTKLLVRSENAYHSMDAKPGAASSKKAVSTGGLEVDRVPAEEWRQIFDEVWRRYRDFFYVENMHGYDWAALRERYRPLLAHVAHRSDLNYVLGEMVAELNVGHAYIAGGDFEIPPRPSCALPGARFELDAQAGRYRIAEILAGHNEEERYRSPLTEIGVDARVGDYLLAVDGEELLGGDNVYRMLRHRAGRPVTLTLNDRPSAEGARAVTYQPITSESSLIYLGWVERNRARVAEMSGGRVGYLHVPDMGGGGIQEFVKWYYGQIHREGLVFDVRSNGGGNVSPMIIERLSRKLAMVDFERNRDLPETSPARTFVGHMAALLDEDTASDGDQFSHHFRVAGLGPLIGKRSWGGVVGIYGRAPLIDGGAVSVPEAGTCDPEGRWIIEGIGVEPDIRIENDPRSAIAGRDPQLERAVEEVLKAMVREPRVLPARPSGPDKTR